jgi:hypothetical protein
VQIENPGYIHLFREDKMRAQSNSVLMAAVSTSIVFVFFFADALADDIQKNQTFGISASVQGGQLDILVPYWAGERFAVVPGFSFVHVSDVANDIGFGLGFRMALKDGDSFPYVGARIGALLFDPESGKSLTDLVMGPFIGGEHFIANRFSISVEAQISVARSNGDSARFGNPGGTNINTASAAMATFYFR